MSDNIYNASSDAIFKLYISKAGENCFGYNLIAP